MKTAVVNTMTLYSKDELIAKFIELSEKGWVKNRRMGNSGGVGNTLEDYLGIEENNLPIPNAAEWELKAQRKNTTSLVTLFHSEPSPRALKFVPCVLLPHYGWQHKEAGRKYPETEMSFRQTITCKYSFKGFLDALESNNIYIDFDARSGHNHGTKFRMSESAWPLVYEKITPIIQDGEVLRTSY